MAEYKTFLTVSQMGEKSLYGNSCSAMVLNALAFVFKMSLSFHLNNYLHKRV